ncbi:MAG: DUF3145 family protein [Aquiluna sp.]|nr:DUF3145 family protein [Aquiluna sp.]
MWVLSCPQNFCEDVKGILAGFGLSGDWTSQPATSHSCQVKIQCELKQRLASELASALAKVRVIAEIESSGVEAERYLIHPGLGIHRQALDSMGEPVIRHAQVDALLKKSKSSLAEFQRELRLVSGQAWLDLIDPLRAPIEGVVYLPRAV